MKALALVLALLFIALPYASVSAQPEDTTDPAGIFRIFLVIDFLVRTFIKVLVTNAIDFCVAIILSSPCAPLWQICGSYLISFISTILDCGSICLYNYGLWMVLTSFIPVLNWCCLPICAVLCIPFSAIIGCLGFLTLLFNILKDLCWRAVQSSF